MPQQSLLSEENRKQQNVRRIGRGTSRRGHWKEQWQHIEHQRLAEPAKTEVSTLCAGVRTTSLQKDVHKLSQTCANLCRTVPKPAHPSPSRQERAAFIVREQSLRPKPRPSASPM